MITTVLAARIRVSDHTHAFHHRHSVHSHNSEKRCDLERDNHALTYSNLNTAKHLDQIKGGRFPVEVLVRGKNAEENEKLFVKITEKIKEAGVSWS